MAVCNALLSLVSFPHYVTSTFVLVRPRLSLAIRPKNQPALIFRIILPYALCLFISNSRLDLSNCCYSKFIFFNFFSIFDSPHRCLIIRNRSTFHDPVTVLLVHLLIDRLIDWLLLIDW